VILIGPQFLEHLLKFGNRHMARLAILRRRLRVAANMDFATRKIHVRPSHIIRLSDPHTAVSQKLDKTCEVLRLPLSPQNSSTAMTGDDFAWPSPRLRIGRCRSLHLTKQVDKRAVGV
jgi:hypothetical protein